MYQFDQRPMPGLFSLNHPSFNSIVSLASLGAFFLRDACSARSIASCSAGPIGLTASAAFNAATWTGAKSNWLSSAVSDRPRFFAKTTSVLALRLSSCKNRTIYDAVPTPHRRKHASLVTAAVPLVLPGQWPVPFIFVLIHRDKTSITIFMAKDIHSLLGRLASLIDIAMQLTFPSITLLVHYIRVSRTV